MNWKLPKWYSVTRSKRMMPILTLIGSLWPLRYFWPSNNSMYPNPSHKYDNFLSHTGEVVHTSVTTLRPSLHSSGVFTTPLFFAVALIAQCVFHMWSTVHQKLSFSLQSLYLLYWAVTVMSEGKTMWVIQSDMLHQDPIQSKHAAIENDN